MSTASTEIEWKGLPPRYGIRKLTMDDVDFATALMSHSMLFLSPLWPNLYPDNITQRVYDMRPSGKYLVEHQIASGMSYAIYDKEYQYKNPESAATGGKLLWDYNDPTADQNKLNEQMDFPLVSLALAYDQINALDFERLGPLVGLVPLFGTIMHHLHVTDTIDPQSWQAKGPNEVLMRNSTVTRQGYEGQGLMKNLAHFLMKEADSKGYRLINIEAYSDAVTKVWANPPAPYQGQKVSELDTRTFSVENEKGEKTYPFHPATIHYLYKIRVHLKGTNKN